MASLYHHHIVLEINLLIRNVVVGNLAAIFVHAGTSTEIYGEYERCIFRTAVFDESNARAVSLAVSKRSEVTILCTSGTMPSEKTAVRIVITGADFIFKLLYYITQTLRSTWGN